MMYITIPPHAVLKTAQTASGQLQAWETNDPDAPAIANVIILKFGKDFVTRVLLNDQSWGSSLDKLYMGMEIRGLFKFSEPGAIVEVEQAQYDALLAVMKAPSTPYNTSMALLLGDFFHAIDKASKEKPAA